MARDAQLAGDRVQTEYYLQYADHYFRVLGENRPRFEDQRGPRGDEGSEDEGDEQFAEAEAEADASVDQRPDREEPRGNTRGDQRPDRGERFNRQRRPRRDEEPEREEAAAEPDDRNAGETIPFDILPPAIGRADGDEAEEPRRPRRRARAARPSGDEDEVVPAA